MTNYTLGGGRQASDADYTVRVYRRKVAAIKKSVYVNIPSKIAKEMGVAKGSVLDVTLQGGRIVLLACQDIEPCMKQEPVPRAEDIPPANDTRVDLRSVLEENSNW